MIFETERLLVRRLSMDDLQSFYEMQSNPLVLQYATGEVMPFEDIKSRLQLLIDKYDIPNNDFWIYAIERKLDNEFIGTVALVKDENNEDEIGYRFLQKYWGNGYGFEVVEGLLVFAKRAGYKKLIGNVVDKNVASVKILERLHFNPVKKFISEDIGLPETRYELKL